MPRISEESIRQVAAASDIVEIIGSYLSLKRAGSAFKALCPFHREKTPSFTVNPARQSFHCFGCGAGGGVIRFVMDYEHLPFVDAVRKLAERAGIRLVEAEGDAGEPSRDRRARLLEAHRLAAAWFQRFLLKDPCGAGARDYLNARGINRDIAVEWGIGFAPDGRDRLASHLLEHHFSPDEISLSGLAFKRDNSSGLSDRFHGRVMIPIRNDYGDVIAFSGRILDPDASPAKYINSPETPLFTKGKILFGLDKTKRALIDADTAIVCEGQFDLIAAYNAGITNVIAPQGTAFTDAQAALLKRFVHTVILCFDADTAGQKAADRSLPALLRRELRVKLLALPPGDDPDSLIRREGGESFRKRAEEAPDILASKISAARRDGRTNSPQGLASVAAEVAGILRLIPDPILRDSSLNFAASELRIATSGLATLLRAAISSPPEPADDEAPAPSQPLRLPPACELLCTIALSSPEARSWLAERTNPSPSALDPSMELLEKILAQSDLESPTALAAFLSTLPAHEQMALAKIETRHPLKEPLTVAQTAWQGLLQNDLRRQIDETKSRLLSPNLHKDEILEIQKEMLDLHGRLKDVLRPSSPAQSARPVENKQENRPASKRPHSY